LDSVKGIIAAVVLLLGVLGLIIGATFLTYDQGTNDPGSKTIQENTDLRQLELVAPNWNLLMSDDEILELHSLRGKFVVVDLMQTGVCVPCQMQTTHLKTLYDGYENRIEILSLSLVLSDTVSRIASYKEENSIPWKVGLDTSGVFGSYFNARSVPTLIIIDGEGYFRWLHVGIWSSDDISSTLSALER
jgi:thiol-disulfide isomerase/thioredoxin